MEIIVRGNVVKKLRPENFVSVNYGKLRNAIKIRTGSELFNLRIWC